MDAPAIKPASQTDWRIITADEVMKWAAGSKKPWSDEVCKEIAESLTKIRCDPPLPKLKNGMHWERSIDWATSPPKIGEWRPEPDTDIDHQWQKFQVATDAAKLLLNNVSALLWHWEGLQQWPETNGGYPAIKAVEGALLAAQPFIDWPFGKSDGPPYRSSSNVWHMPAVVVAGIIGKALARSGQRAPKFTKESAATRVVHEALKRMGCPANLFGLSAIEQFLGRRKAKLARLAEQARRAVAEAEAKFK
jgi:hypothetical protein